MAGESSSASILVPGAGEASTTSGDVRTSGMYLLSIFYILHVLFKYLNITNCIS